MNNELNLETKNLPTYDEIIKGRELLKNFIGKTPLSKSNTFSNLIGTNIFLKNEAFQKTGSFKVRGALYKINSLSEEELKYGIIAASAGNHAQGVAYSCNLLGIFGKIFMPATTPRQKIKQVELFGKELIE